MNQTHAFYDTGRPGARTKNKMSCPNDFYSIQTNKSEKY